ncbi:MAG: antibiotic biosynthesis monooxygenase [Gammaproteobacteria bacterium]|nr:antibiotic biosynthesis monooxygenase [Gammaproteobacteria bacterium]
MYVVTNRIPVDTRWAAKFEARFQNRAGQIDKQPGLIRMQVLKPKTEGAPYLVSTAWENEAAFRNWVGSDDFKAAHANPLPAEAFSGESEMEQHEVIISTEASSNRA